jgi:7,8-dihydropterin-6-yl-methyl-4-(beta-D-ribofuranosyl)aminobenzene 5'-phosphate synthase
MKSFGTWFLGWELKMWTIAEVYNNLQFNPVCIPKWGFSCYIEEKKLLFDTGGEGAVLLENMHNMGIDPAGLDVIVLSHDHGDHTGGVKAVLEQNSDLEIYLLEAFSRKTRSLVESFLKPITISVWTEIDDGIFVTGPLGDSIIEQSLVLHTENGFFIITGCAHPHIGTIIKITERQGPVWGAMGGFHTLSEADVEVLGSLSYISASHCTENPSQLVQRHPGICVPGGVGKVHKIE